MRTRTVRILICTGVIGALLNIASPANTSHPMCESCPEEFPTHPCLVFPKNVCL